MARQIRPGQLQENVLYDISSSYAVTASFALNGGGGGNTFPYTGSAEITGSLNVIGEFTSSGLNYPTTDGDEKQIISTDSSGNLTFDWADRTNIDVKNTSGATLEIGTPIYITGYQGASIFQIAAASASDSNKMPAIGVLSQTLNSNDQGYATLLGALRGYDTQTYSVNDSLYVGEGILTSSRPTGSSLIQKIARVGNIASNGEITILGAGRTNDIPNITSGYIWVGNNDSIATAISTSSIQNVISSSYALQALTASYAVSASHEIIKEVSSSYADTASFAQSGDGIFSGSFSGSYEGDGSQLTGIEPFPFVGDAVITGSLNISGSSHRIEGSTVIYSTGTPGLTVQSNSDTAEEVKIYDAKIDVEDSGYMAARLSSNAYGSRIGILDLRHWAGNAGAVITAKPEKISYIQSSLLIGKTGDPTATGTYKLDVNGDIKLGNGTDDSIEILGPVTASTDISSSAASTASFGHYIGDGSEITGVISSSYAVTASFALNGGGGSTDTGSLLTTASVSLNTITFTKGDGSTFPITVDTGSGGGGGVPDGTVSSSAQITELGFVTSSATSSFVLNSQTSSMSVATASYVETAQSASYVLQAVSASYAPSADTFPFTGDAVITGSLTISGSFHSFVLDSDNIVLGENAGGSMIATADDNVIIGTEAAGETAYNFSGDGNVVVGHQAGFKLSTGGSNVLIGLEAGKLVDNDSSNVFLGTYAGRYQNVVGTSISIGYNALRGGDAGGSTSTGNIAIGYRAGEVVDGAIYNNMMGFLAGVALSTGDYNTLFGYYAGSSITTGNGNIIIGSGSTGAPAISNQLRIGNGNTITTISASLETGDIIFPSTASATYFVGDGSELTNLTLPAGILSSSAQIATDISGAFSADSASFSTRVTTNETNISTLTAATSSYILASQTSSMTVLSSSFAITASHALNAGGGTPTFIASGSTSASAAPDTGVVVEHSGSTAFSVIGDVGTLFSVDDDLNGMLFTANDISGFPVLQASASGDVFIGKSPQSLYTTTVISSTTAATTHSLCTLSTSSYDGAFFEYTAQSASNARAGNIMSTWNGTNIVYAETTTTDIGDTSDLTTEVIISGSTARLIAYGPNASYKIKTIIKAI